MRLFPRYWLLATMLIDVHKGNIGDKERGLGWGRITGIEDLNMILDRSVAKFGKLINPFQEASAKKIAIVIKMLG